MEFESTYITMFYSPFFQSKTVENLSELKVGSRKVYHPFSESVVSDKKSFSQITVIRPS